MESPFCKIRRPAHIAGVKLFPSSSSWLLFASRLRLRRRPRPNPPLNAADILRAVREGQASRHDALDGQLRNDSDGKVFPFRLIADGPQVRYKFAGKPPTVVQVRYNEDDSQLEESTRRRHRETDPGQLRQENPRHRPVLRGPRVAFRLLVAARRSRATTAIRTRPRGSCGSTRRPIARSIRA